LKKNVTIVYSIKRSFVKSDISILEALEYNVFQIQSRPKKTLMSFVVSRIKEKIKSIFYVSRSEIVIIWFNDYHAFIPIIFSKLFFKKSVIIVGGYDAIVDKQNRHGLFFRKGIRSKLAKINYRLVSEIWVVHKSLEKGCTYAKEKFNIVSGIRNFLDNKKLVIKEISTGYDTRFWDYDSNNQKIGVLTAAYFSDERVINIKGLDIFNKLAFLMPDVSFTIVGETKIQIDNLINLNPNVNVLGVQTRTQLKQLYQNSKFYFQGSRLEGLPNSVCEAMLCGCIPIGSRVFGIPDIIGNTGVLFDTEKDLVKVKDFMLSGIGEKESKQARNRIISKFNISKRIEKIKENID
tara:strand:+ start:1811 stop:2857 length:1047 start_codon:yes stop_codon:yes gene_type:complete